MEFSEKIKLIRETARLSQQELAKEVGCSQAIISAYELGTKKPSYENLEKLITVIKKYKLKVKLI